MVSRAGILQFFSMQSQEDFPSGECLLVCKFSCKLDFIFLFWNMSSMNLSECLVCFDFSWKIILQMTKRSVIYVYMQICLYTYLYLCVYECMYVYRDIGTLDVLNNWRKAAKSEQLEKIIRKLVPIIILIKRVECENCSKFYSCVNTKLQVCFIKDLTSFRWWTYALSQKIYGVCLNHS